MNKKVPNDDHLKSLGVSIAVCIPAFFVAFMVMETRGLPVAAALVIPGVFGLAALNFLLVGFLEYRRRDIGDLTIPALLAAIAVVFLFVVSGAFDRFVHNIGYGWLMPAVLLYLAFVARAVFREKTFVLKCLLGLNALAMAALWGIGAMGKVVLPF